MKRWLLRICVFLLLGAIVNVAVAWGFAITSRLGELGEFRQIGNAADGDTVVIVWEELGGAIAGFDHGGWATQREYGELWAEPADLPTWPSMEHDRDGVTFEVAFGAPFLAVLYWSDVGMRIDDGIKLGEQTSAPFPHNGDVLPLRPIWPGFAINTVFYALGGWLLFAGPFVVRRWRRIRRGLCPKCAYDLRGATSEVCPECGARK